MPYADVREANAQKKRWQEDNPEWCANYRREWIKKNPEKRRLYELRQRQRNPAQQAAKMRRQKLRREYGLTVAQFDAMVEEQHGVCAICGSPPAPTRKRLCIDHDHETGRVRGLLCDRCNMTVGFMESPLRVAVEGYLMEHQMPEIPGNEPGMPGMANPMLGGPGFPGRRPMR